MINGALIGFMVITVSSTARISHLYVRFDHVREQIRLRRSMIAVFISRAPGYRERKRARH